MDLMVKKLNGEWYSSFPRRGAVYDLANAALSRRTPEDRLQAVVLLGDNDPSIRGAATTTLGHLKSGRSVEALLDRLRDPGEEPGIRNLAIEALATIRSTGAIRGLREFATEPAEDPALRSAAGEYLSRVGT